jgi:hypothetical protein
VTSLVLELEIKFREEHGPVGLLMIKKLGGHKIFKTFVVGDDFDGMRGTDKPRMHIAKGVDDSKKFLVMDFIINFRGGEFVRMIGNRV